MSKPPDERIAQYDAHIQAHAKADSGARQLMRRPVWAASQRLRYQHHRSGSRFPGAVASSAPGWAGAGAVQPGGKQRLGRITKAGDYLRSLLVMGACRLAVSEEQDGSAEPLGQLPGRAAGLLAGGGGHRCQECAHVLGHVEQRGCVHMPA